MHHSSKHPAGGTIKSALPLLAVALSTTAASFPDTWSVFAPIDYAAFKPAADSIPMHLIADTLFAKSDTVQAKEVKLVNDEIDFTQIGLPVIEKVTAVAYAYIESPTAQSLPVGAGADWWMEWFVNGSKVYSTMNSGNGSSRYTVDDHRFDLPLKAGKNLVTIVVRSGSGGFRLACGGSDSFKRIALLEAARKVQADSLLEEAGSAITRLRTAPLTIHTTPGARVTIRQQKHQFPFGTAIAGKFFDPDDTSEDTRTYLDTLKRYFNYAVHENELKWYHTEKKGPLDPNYTQADRSLAWCLDNGIGMRGHCLFWEVEKYVQPWVRELDDSTLLAHVRRRAAEVTARYRGRIDEFDLNNEMLHGDFYTRRLGPSAIVEMARAAREGNPDVILYVNDFNVPGFRTADYIRQIADFQARGVGIGGIGIQCHFGNSLDFSAIKRDLDALGTLGLPIRITELDFSTSDEELKAELLSTFMQVVYGHPMVTAILLWGFWEGAHWVPQAALWKKDWTPTPAAKAYADLVFGQWWTDTTLIADKKGICQAPVFLGSHQVSINDQIREIVVSVPAEPVVLDLRQQKKKRSGR